MTDGVKQAPRRAGWLQRWRGSLLSVLLLVGALGLGLYFKVFAPVQARAYKVERGELVVQVFGRGTIESRRVAQLGFDLIGRLSEVLVDEGERVTLGQELARLSPEQLEAGLKGASSGVSAAKATLKRLATEEQRAREALKIAEREAKRMTKLSQSGVIAEIDLDRAIDQTQLARTELDRVLATQREATRGIDIAGSTVAERKANVLRATLLAPFDGLIVRRLREPGDTVSVGSTVLRLVDTEQVYVSAWIDETVLGDIAEGQAARIYLPGGKILVGLVTRVGWESDRQTHELLIEVTPSESLGRISIGQRADVWISTKTKSDTLRIPTGLIQRDEVGAYCYVDRGGHINKARLQLGLLGREQVEVLEGLLEGDTVLAPLKPGGALAEGRRWVAP